ncbi:MAG: CTP synthase (glutamine hydrolyzing) [Candidatus Aenigmarchaeota archaeon]|nr:CTP synthase (glutamine hydrolyzing) [Candidatus Aenigmarchaeota archaeon]
MTPNPRKVLAEKTLERESYSPFPEGYVKGKTKYVIVTGSVMSGVGKGTFSGALCTLLSCHGLKISPVKFDGYINFDAGTLNPFRHGEVFVLQDGTECDLDLGSYERALHRNLTKDNYLTGGKIFKIIIDKERAGKYLGRDVQFIPHVTGEIKYFLRNLAMKSGADIVLVEVGGTVGDLENSYFVEAMRELRHEEGQSNVMFVNVTYIIEPGSLREHKSKAAQIGFRQLMALGVQPDMIICRSQTPITNSVADKISVFANVPPERVYNLYDFSNVYEIPLILRGIGLDAELFKIFGIAPRENHDSLMNFDNWENFVEKIKNAKKEISVGIVGKYTNVHDSYLSIIKSLEHAAPYFSASVKIKWIESTDIEDEKISAEEALKGFDGIIVPGGFGKRGIEGKIQAIKYVRENNIPYLGLCYGLQLAVVEFARNVCGLKDANTAEVDPETECPIIDIIPDQDSNIENSRIGGTMRLGDYPAKLKPDSLARKLYGKDTVVERHRHRYELVHKFHKILEEKGLVISGTYEEKDLPEFIEIPGHRFFLATQAHAEFTSRPLQPNPMFLGFIEACVK